MPEGGWECDWWQLTRLPPTLGHIEHVLNRLLPDTPREEVTCKVAAMICAFVIVAEAATAARSTLEGWGRRDMQCRCTGNPHCEGVLVLCSEGMSWLC